MKTATVNINPNTTKTEMSFLDGIVSGKWVENHSLERAKKALQGYIATAFIRRWDGGVNVTDVSNHAKKLLAVM